MKIAAVKFSNRRKEFDVTVGSEALGFPYLKAVPVATPDNPVVLAFVDDELGKEAFTYQLKDGQEGTIHIDHVLEYNEDPQFMWDLFMHRITVEVRKRLEESDYSKRVIARRLHTSPSQLYRLLDEDRSSKSMQQLFEILHTLECDIDVVIKRRQGSTPNLGIKRMLKRSRARGDGRALVSFGTARGG